MRYSDFRVGTFYYVSPCITSVCYIRTYTS